MPSIDLYCAPDDVLDLIGVFADEFAFIVTDGPSEWRAVTDFVPADGSTTMLWHIPSGPLPLAGAVYMKDGGVPDVYPDDVIDDPFAGWTEQRAGANPDVPWFGVSCVGVMELRLRMKAMDEKSTCGISNIGWIGNHYSIIGEGAPEVTKKRWNKLRRQIAKIATKVPRGGLSAQGKPEIFAFPHALKDLNTADMNPSLR